MSDAPGRPLQAAVETIALARDDLAWSIRVSREGVPRAAFDDVAVLPTASVGKILLLAEVARRIEREPSFAAVSLSKPTVEAVSEAGLWQYLASPALPVADLACLAAGLSDNLATNALMGHVGLDAVQSLARSFGLRETMLLDRVRVRRGPHDPPHLSVGRASDWCEIIDRVACGRLLSPAVSAMLRFWLAGNADCSMVAAAFDVDPLAHRQDEGDIALFNKTGSDAGTRADVGSVFCRDARVSYAAIVHWQGGGKEAETSALAGMRALGRAIRDDLSEHLDARP